MKKENFRILYDDEYEKQIKRCENLQKKFFEYFGKAPEVVLSSPGRSEIIGNHTDHQNGCVITAAVNADIMGIASKRDDNLCIIYSEGYNKIQVDLSSIEVKENEANTSEALVRGVAHGITLKGCKIGGFNAVMNSEVLTGSGLSSSAAFENLLVGIFNYLYNNGDIDPLSTALISKFAENNYFMKPCGLEDQLASSIGAISFIDFKEADAPLYEKIEFDIAQYGYHLIITDTGAQHSDLTSDYAQITDHMKSIANYLGSNTLRFTNEHEFYTSISELRNVFGDKAVLRAHHFYEENKRTMEAFSKIKKEDFQGFLNCVNDSGCSSEVYLQNIFSINTPEIQSIEIALMISRHILAGEGSVRVHGGGFAGTITAIVPENLSEKYKETMDFIFGKGSAVEYKIRKYGVFRLE